MEKISACLVVYNEEKLIGRCLDSLHGVVDEIILVHDGECSDKTLEIAQSYGAKIFVRPFYGVAEGQRPFSYEQASYDWILQIDADEFLSEELRNNLKLLVNDKKTAAYKTIWPLWDGNKEIKASWPYKIFLFRKGSVSMLGLVHFMVDVRGRTKKINFKLHHQPAYNNFSYKSFLRKQLVWARLQAGKYLQDFSSVPKFNRAEEDWLKSIKLRIKFPLLLLPLEFIWTFFKKTLGGNYKLGLLGLKDAFMMASYRAAVNYNIYKLRRKK